MTDANGNTTTYTYDADNEQTQITRPDSSTTKTGYDGDGNVLTQTDGNGHTTTYTYDPLNRVASTTNPDGHTTTDSYDGAGNLLTSVDPSGRTTGYSYDAANRVTGISYSDGSTPNVTESYDADGRRITLKDGTGISTFSYDTLGNLTSQTNGAGLTTSFAYDPASQVTGITYPNGKIVARAYDAAGQVKSVTDWLGNTTSFGHDGDGNLTSEAAPGSVTATSTFDAADRLTAISDKQGTSTLASFSYSRDALGQLTASNTSGALTGSDSYSYDSQNRLTTDNNAAYGYDSADNPTTYVDGQSQAFDPADQLLSSGPAATSGGGGGGGTGAGGGSTGAPTGSGGGAGGGPGGPSAPGRQRTCADPGVHSQGRRRLRRLDQHCAPRLPEGRTHDQAVRRPRAGLPAAQTPARSPRIRSVGIHWLRVSRAGSGAGSVTIWQARTSRKLSRRSVIVQLPKGSSHGLLSVVAFKPGATLGAHQSRTGHHGVATLKVKIPASAMIFTIGHDAATGKARKLLAGSHLVKQVRSAQKHDDSWLQQSRASKAGVTTLGERGPASTSWALASVVIQPSVGARPHSVLTDMSGSRTFGYNAEGDRTRVTGRGTTITLGYDQANRLTSVSGNISYSYDGDSLRMSKSVAGTTTQFAWDESGNLPLLLQDGSTYYIYGPNGQPIEQVTGTTPRIYSPISKAAPAYSQTPAAMSSVLTATIRGAT